MKITSITILLLLMFTSIAYPLEYTQVSEHIGENLIIIMNTAYTQGIYGQMINIFVKKGTYYMILKQENGEIKFINCKNIYSIVGVKKNVEQGDEE